MCGIVGLVEAPGVGLAARLAAMSATLVHRGPDDAGAVAGEVEGVGLGMRRLAILDIEGGRQPMCNEDDTLVIVFNGEIYNFRELRRELAACGHTFTTDHSDTEVVLHGFEEWGDGVFSRLNGMFAVAIWDRRQNLVTIARDRMGKKPLYVARTPTGFAFASELKAIFALPHITREVDPLALEQYLAFDYVIGPRTIIRGIEKLPGGSVGKLERLGYTYRQYWEPTFGPGLPSRADAIAELDHALDAAVRRRMVADVPVGLFLSGGLDSTTVGYYMRRHADDVHSFSIGFEEPEWDESRYARLAAAHLGITHHHEVLSAARVQELVPRVPEILDEPMGDQSILPTFLLSRATRAHVKVALGGDGSDELLMGYRRYQALKLMWQVDRLPAGVRRLLAEGATRVPPRIAGRRVRGRIAGSELALSPADRLLAQLGSFRGRGRAVLSPAIQAELPSSVFDETANAKVALNGDWSAANETIGAYVRGYLQEDILVKVDRASMAASLEVRAPFLDPDVVSVALTASAGQKMPWLRRKRLLRDLMRGRLPRTIVDRPKMGFGAPVSPWLRGPLRPLVVDMLSPARIRTGGYFDAGEVQRLRDAHLRAEEDHGLKLWLILQFELWRERWLT